MLLQNFSKSPWKVLIIVWTIWNHRNNIIFKNHTCSLAFVLDSAVKTYQGAILYSNAICSVLRKMLQVRSIKTSIIRVWLLAGDLLWTAGFNGRLMHLELNQLNWSGLAIFVGIAQGGSLESEATRLVIV